MVLSGPSNGSAHTCNVPVRPLHPNPWIYMYTGPIIVVFGQNKVSKLYLGKAKCPVCARCPQLVPECPMF